MTFYFLYFGLLGLWLPLLWPAWRMEGRWAKGWMWLVILAGVLASLNEVRQWFGPPSAIRLDIPFISFALVLIYTAAIAVLFWRGWRRLAILLGFILAVIAGAMVYEWIRVGREAERYEALFIERDKLLFEAKFSSDERYQDYFGPLGDNGDAHPSGHWSVIDNTRYTRLIINDAGQAWLFFRCRHNECQLHAPNANRLHGGGDARNWAAVFAARHLAPRTAVIQQETTDRLAVTIKGEGSFTAVKSPPPITQDQTPKTIKFLGRFAAFECAVNRIRFRQLWLWQSGEELLGVGIFATPRPGRRVETLLPIVLGAGVARQGAWFFQWDRNGLFGKAEVVHDGSAIVLTLQDRNRDQETIRLLPEPEVRDEVVELAPLTNEKDWHHWFEVVLLGHYASGDMPSCG